MSEKQSQSLKTTPIKARIQGAVDFLEKKGIKGLNEDVFRANKVSHATGYRILKSRNPRTLVNNPTRKETRGRKKVITPEQIREMEMILENEGLEGRGLTWEQLGMEVGMEATKMTIKNTVNISGLPLLPRYLSENYPIYPKDVNYVPTTPT